MKKFTSWGHYADVKTKRGNYQNVIVCPDPDNEENHLLEASNGYVVRVNTSDLMKITTEVNGNTYTTNC